MGRFVPTCGGCGESSPSNSLNCDFCGRRLTTSPQRVKGKKRDILYIEAIELKALLWPLIQLNSYAWVAKHIGIDEAELWRNLNERDYLEFWVVDGWISKLGMPHALYDGSLTVKSA